MIQEAMQNEKYGATPAVQPPPGNQARTGGGTAGPSAVDSALGENAAVEQNEKQNNKDAGSKTDVKKK